MSDAKQKSAEALSANWYVIKIHIGHCKDESMKQDAARSSAERQFTFKKKNGSFSTETAILVYIPTSC